MDYYHAPEHNYGNNYGNKDYYHAPEHNYGNNYGNNYGYQPAYGGYDSGYHSDVNQGAIPNHLMLEVLAVPEEDRKKREAAPKAEKASEPDPVDDAFDDFVDADDEDDAADKLRAGDNARLGGDYEKDFDVYCVDPHTLGNRPEQVLGERIAYTGEFEVEIEPRWPSPYKLWGQVAERIGKVESIKLKKEIFASRSFCSTFLNLFTCIIPFKVNLYRMVIRPDWVPNVLYLEDRRSDDRVGASNYDSHLKSHAEHKDPLHVSVTKPADCEIANIISGRVLLITWVWGEGWVFYAGTVTAVATVGRDNQIDEGRIPGGNTLTDEEILEGMCDHDVVSAIPWKWTFDLRRLNLADLFRVFTQELSNKVSEVLPKIAPKTAAP